MAKVTLTGLPVYTLASYHGVGHAPDALRRAGILDALGPVSDRGDVPVPPLKEDRVHKGVKNLSHFKGATALIYEETKSVHDDLAVFLGGECSVVVGSMAGLASSLGRDGGVLWMDAHGDFNTTESSPSGYIGGMCLAMVCGLTPKPWFNFGGAPPFTPERLVHVGARDLDPPEAEAFRSLGVSSFPPERIRKEGVAPVAKATAKKLADSSDWVVCHVDVDALDPKFIPAVNYPAPGGLTPSEVSAFVRELRRTGKMRALEVTSYNASLDRDGSSAGAIVGLVKETLS